MLGRVGLDLEMNVPDLDEDPAADEKLRAAFQEVGGMERLAQTLDAILSLTLVFRDADSRDLFFKGLEEKKAQSLEGLILYASEQDPSELVHICRVESNFSAALDTMRDVFLLFDIPTDFRPSNLDTILDMAKDDVCAAYFGWVQARLSGEIQAHDL